MPTYFIKLYILACNYNCKSCINMPNNCIMCSNNHAYPPNCECSPGFYL